MVIRDDDQNKILTGLPIKNFQSENIALLISLSDYGKIENIRRSFFVLTVIYIIFLLLITLLSYVYTSTRRRMDRMMRTDQLTKIDNRRILLEKLDDENNRFYRYHRPYSIVMIDIDHFKRINDTYGHLTGDEILSSLSKLIKDNIRQSDTFGRYGGEEFILLLPETTLEQAVAVAENLRETVENHNFMESESITISIGVADVIAELKNIEGLIEKADENLYRAKESGRNRVCY